MGKLGNEVVKHWEENLKKAKDELLTTGDIDGTNCAFCCEYMSCSFCPVYLHTGQSSCNGTPWRRVKHCLLYSRPKHELVEAVKEELEFLKMIRRENPHA